MSYNASYAPQKSGLCIAGFVIALVSIFLCGLLGPISLILSIAGVVTASKNGYGGKGMGIAGIILSVVCIFELLFAGLIIFAGSSKYLQEYKDRMGGRTTQEAVLSDSGKKVKKDFGTYEISSDWTEAHEGPDGIYYCRKGNENADMPNNIKVSYGTNPYSKDEILDFKSAIQQQLALQVQGSNAVVTGSGSTSKNGYDIITFNIEASEEDGSAPSKCTQYYIVGDKEYVMVSLMIWDEKEDRKDKTEDCAEMILDSFVWAE